MFAMASLPSPDIENQPWTEALARPALPREGDRSAWPRNRLPKSPRRQACFLVSSTSYRAPRPLLLRLIFARSSCPTWFSKSPATSRSTPTAASRPIPRSGNAAQDLQQGVLQQLHETQVEQDFNHVLLRGLGYKTQSDVASDHPWTLTPKWPVSGSGEADAALGKFRLDESGSLSAEPLVMVELKGAKVDLDRKMPTRNITPVQQVWNYLNASESAQWAIVCNYAEIRLYSRQKSSNHLHRVLLTELDDPDRFAEFYAIFHADSLLGTGIRKSEEIRCQFIILARKDELTPDFAKRRTDTGFRRISIPVVGRPSVRHFNETQTQPCRMPRSSRCNWANDGFIHAQVVLIDFEMVGTQSGQRRSSEGSTGLFQPRLMGHRLVQLFLCESDCIGG